MLRFGLIAAIPGALLPAGMAVAQTRTAEQVQQIVAILSQNMVQTGAAVGVGAGVVYPGLPAASYAFGVANVATETPFATDSLFEISSLTKVFTTAMLGEEVAFGRLSLSTNLAQLSAEVGAVQPLAGQATLLELADMTAGFPLEPLQCSQQSGPGCIPNSRPTLKQYTVQDFLDFVRTIVPADYAVTPPVPLTALPGPEAYSDASEGLLGLLLGSIPNAIGPGAVNAWYHQLNRRLLSPLGMTSTFVDVPATIPASGIPLVAMAWSIQPADTTNGIPPVIAKAGGLNGFSSQIVLIPQDRIAVVVLVNAGAQNQAPILAYQIAFQLHYLLSQ